MLDYTDRSKVYCKGERHPGQSHRHNCENQGEEARKCPPKKLFLLVPQADSVSKLVASPRSARNTNIPTPQNLSKSFHNSTNLTPSKQAQESSFTQKSKMRFLQKCTQSSSTHIYAKQNSIRSFHNQDSRNTCKGQVFKDINNVQQSKSNLYLRQSVTSTKSWLKNTLPPKPAKSPSQMQIEHNQLKEKDISRSKDKLNPSKFMPKHTRTRTTAQENEGERSTFKFKLQQSESNTPKTNTPRTTTSSMEKVTISINVKPNPNNHASNTVSSFQKFLAKRLSCTLNQPRAWQLSDFEIGPCKGEGRFGKVYPALHKRTGFLLAMKKIKKELVRGMLKQFIGQLKIGLFLCHANIVKTYGIFDDSTYIYVLMEYMEEGSLYRTVRVGKMDEDEAAPKLLEICQAVNYLHSLSILHRDIKPENIVVSNGVCKLCDFGWAVCSRERRKTYCGTLDYVCPEILQGEEYDNEVDIWAIGVLAFEMLTGKAPFYHVSREETMISIMKCEFEFPEGMSADAKAFIAKALRKNPNQRMTIQQLLKENFLKEDDQ